MVVITLDELIGLGIIAILILFWIVIGILIKITDVIDGIKRKWRKTKGV